MCFFTLRQMSTTSKAMFSPSRSQSSHKINKSAFAASCFKVFSICA
jgi:hypothetical protein